MPNVIKGLKGVVVEVLDYKEGSSLERGADADIDPSFLDTFIDDTKSLHVGDTYVTKEVKVGTIDGAIISALLQISNDVRELKKLDPFTLEEFKAQIKTLDIGATNKVLVGDTKTRK